MYNVKEGLHSHKLQTVLTSDRSEDGVGELTTSFKIQISQSTQVYRETMSETL